MASSWEVYLAGPDVFLPNPLEIGAEKKRICAKYGLVGLFPLDTDLEFSRLPAKQKRSAIYEANVALMNRCDAVIANMTPFRGPSLDAGTAFEIGYARGLDKPIFGYTNDSREYRHRVDGAPMFGTNPVDRDGMAIEDFGAADNLMLVEAIEHSGFPIVQYSAPVHLRMTDLTAFERCVAAAANGSLRLNAMYSPRL